MTLLTINAGKEVTLEEFTKLLNSVINTFRRSRKLSDELEDLYLYIEAILDKETHHGDRFRLSMDDFVGLW